jgi:hypothetical protein
LALRRAVQQWNDANGCNDDDDDDMVDVDVNVRRLDASAVRSFVDGKSNVREIVCLRFV